MRISEVWTYPDSHITIAGRTNTRHLTEHDGSQGLPAIRMELVKELNSIRIQENDKRPVYVPMSSVMQFYLAEEPAAERTQQRKGNEGARAVG